MKYILFILLLPIVCLGQIEIPVPYDHVSGGEYSGLITKYSTHKAYNFLNVVPAICTGQPTTVYEVWGGPHDCFETDGSGNLYFSGLNSGGEGGIGSQSSTCAGCMVQVTVDSAGNPITGVTQVLNTGTNFGTFWTTAIVMNGAVGLAGNLQGGLRGVGTAGAAVNTKFVWVPFPAGTYIVKVTGLYGIHALDTAGQVWAWGYNNNLAELGRGNSPSPNYESPGKVTLPVGRRAVDVTGAGGYTVILLDDGSLLGIGDHPKYWGGPSASSSNSPQNFTSLAYATIKTPTGAEDTVKNVDCNNGSIYYRTFDSTLWSSGDNTCGTIGNGDMFNFANYKCCPGPSSGSPFPYDYDNGYEEHMFSTYYNIAPGTHNWIRTYCGKSNCWFAHAVNNKGETWGWGRGKAGQLVDSIASCNYNAGGQTALYPDALEMPWPVKILPFSWNSATQVNCPLCWINPSATNCSQCSQTQGSAPTVNAGPNQNLPGITTSTTMAGSATGASGAKIFQAAWSVVSAPNTPIITFPSSYTTPVSNLAQGKTVLLLTVTDQFSVSNTSTVTITVGCGCFQIPIGSRINVVKSLNKIYHGKDFGIDNPLYPILGKESEYMSFDFLRSYSSSRRGYGYIRRTF